MKRVIDFTTASADPDPRDECRRLERLLAGYQQFLGHDLCNQLVPIHAYAKMLREQCGGLDAEARTLLTRLTDLTRKADQQARRLAEIGRLLREPAWGPPLPLAPAIAEAVAEVRCSPRSASASGIAWDVVQQMPEVVASRKLLHAVLVELLHNAVAATVPGRPGRIGISAAVAGPGLVLTVRDDGRGMAPAQLERLGAFGEGGSGFGLFLAAQAVARWRGRLTVESAPGEGTTVQVYLPGNVA
jgi:signal transduction histidine kinase